MGSEVVWIWLRRQGKSRRLDSNNLGLSSALFIQFSPQERYLYGGKIGGLDSHCPLVCHLTALLAHCFLPLEFLNNDFWVAKVKGKPAARSLSSGHVTSNEQKCGH